MPMILTCTDGSVYSTSVCDHAAWAARRLGAEVHVLHISEKSDDGVYNPDQKDHERAGAILADAKARLEAAGVGPVVVHEQQGAPVHAIGALEADAGLIVVGKRGEHTESMELGLGGNLDRVIRGCHHPVLAAPRVFAPIGRFVLAFDARSAAKKAVAYAAGQPLLRGLPCHLVAVGTANPVQAADLEVARSHLVDAGFSVTVAQIPGEPEVVIADAVKRLGADLLVMGAYGHSRVREFILGSITAAVISTVPVPVLMFR